MQIFKFKSRTYFGGLCNILMSGTVDKTTVSFIEDQMKQISQEHIKQLIKRLNPLLSDPAENVYETFGRTILHQYRKKTQEKVNREAIISEIMAHGIEINVGFGNKLGQMLESECLTNALKIGVDKSSSNSPPTEKSVSNGLFKPVERVVIPQNPPKLQVSNTQNIFGKVPPHRSSGILGNFGDHKSSQDCVNLISRPQCLCENLKNIESKDQSSFKCVHCNRLYHTVCLKKKSTSEFCCYCHLEKMAPLKRAVRTIYVGLMKKAKKKHNAKFIMPEIDHNHKVQVRCLRLKDGAQLSCLFPDVAELSMNGQRCTIFEPINKQSCLKYRKDEPYTLLRNDLYKGQENTLVISQNIQVNKEKDIRNDPQNHIIGVYAIEDVKIQQLITEIKSQNTLGFSQSEEVLRQSFGLGKDDEITCQLVKIPLHCPLTTAKIQIPARGKYCTHFQCFDLRNYLTLISESQNPRWKCPLCPALAFEFQIDSILHEIIKEAKSNENIKEVLFFKNGDYSMIIDQEPLPERKNIRSLNIPERKKQISSQPQPLDKPRKRPNFIVPTNTQIIELDD